jgi:protein-L-isoaspartate O-methyltransferase
MQRPPRRLVPWSFLLLLVSIALGCARAPGSVAPDVRTPQVVVVEMLRLAQVTSRDVVYDLGSADGRIVITAAQEFGARGVGLEIEPDLVAEAERNARRAKVADRVRFVQQDIFEADLSEATVVTIYLSAEANARLRPKLLAQLKPGSRIVSHDFPMAAWKPDRVVNFKGPERTHVLSLWIVPAR